MSESSSTDEFAMRPIGVIHSPFHEPESTPIQAIRSQAVGMVEVFPQYSQGLRGLAEFSHIFLIYAFHRSDGYSLLVKPFLDDDQHGLFATRHPRRPNPIGFSVVRLSKIEDNLLTVEGIDVLDKTPLLDIKPYVPDFDQRDEVQTGWYSRRSKL